MLPGHIKCIFDQPAENFSLKDQKLFAQSPKKNIVLKSFPKIFPWKRSFDNPAEKFPLKVRKSNKLMNLFKHFFSELFFWTRGDQFWKDQTKRLPLNICKNKKFQKSSKKCCGSKNLSGHADFIFGSTSQNSWNFFSHKARIKLEISRFFNKKCWKSSSQIQFWEYHFCLKLKLYLLS